MSERRIAKGESSARWPKALREFVIPSESEESILGMPSKLRTFLCLTTEAQRNINKINLCALCVSVVKIKKFDISEHNLQDLGRKR
jgi:hypothetical protein